MIKMIRENTLERYLHNLLDGDRIACRAVIEETLQSGVPANCVYMDIIWPIMLEIEKLHKEDKISSAVEAFATRINRTLADQLQNKLPRKMQRNRNIVICTAGDERAELGGQIVADLFESDGWQVRFLGGRINSDETLEFIHKFRPDILLFCGITAAETPGIRSLIDTIRAINAFPEMKIMLTGGIFNRAAGLWEEIGADLYAPDAMQAVRVADADENETPKPQRMIKKRRKPCPETDRTRQVQTTAQEF